LVKALVEERFVRVACREPSALAREMRAENYARLDHAQFT